MLYYRSCLKDNYNLGVVILSFDKKAKDWDDSRRIQRSKIIADKINEFMDLQDSFSALEFGCGTGLISLNLYDKLSKITCIDTSSGMIKQLEDKVADNNLGKITVAQVNINDEHNLTSEYDVIYSSMSLHHVIQLEETLQSFHNLLQDGGQLCIVDLDKEDGSFHSQETNFLGHNGFDQNELSQLLEQVGFNNITSETFYRDERSIGNRNIEYSLFIMKAQK